MYAGPTFTPKLCCFKPLVHTPFDTFPLDTNRGQEQDSRDLTKFTFLNEGYGNP